MASFIDVESLFLRVVSDVAQMPFSEETRGVAGLFQRFGDGNLFERKLVEVCRSYKSAVFWVVSGDPIGDVQPGRILARHDAGPCGGADGAGCVGVGEAHAFGGQFVNVWCFVESASVAAKVGPAQVVDEEKDEIGPFMFRSA